MKIVTSRPSRKEKGGRERWRYIEEMDGIEEESWKGYNAVHYIVPRLLQILSPRYIDIQLWEKIGTPCSNVCS